MTRIPCGNCGGKIGVPAGHTKAKIRCSHCGYYAEVPAAMRAAAPPDAADTAPVKASSPSAPTAPSPKAPKPKAPAAVEDAYTAAKLRAAPAPEDDGAPAAKPATRPKARARPDANDTRPEFLVGEDTGPPMLEGTQDEHDDEVRPYAVPGTGLKKCPHCNGELPLDATFCVNCGEHLAGHPDGDARPTGKRKRTYQPMSGGWVEGWSWETRVAIIIGLQVTNLLMIALLMTVNGQSLSDGEVWTKNLTYNLFNIFLQVFIVGSYEGFTFERTEAGKTTMWRHRRIAFAKLAPQKVKWKSSTGVGVLATHDPGLAAWFIFAYLFLCGIVPGIVFYLMVIRPERFSPALCDEYRSVQEVLLRSKDREQATVIAKMLSNATGLRYHQVL